MEISAQPWAVIAVAAGTGWVPVGTVPDAGAVHEHCDLHTIDHLLRLFLEARRRGLSIRLTDVHPHLRELAELVGVTDQLGIT